MRRSVTAFSLALSILAGGTLGTTGLHAQTGLRSVVPDPLGGMPVPGALPAPGAGMAPGAGAARGASPSAPGASSAAVGGAARQATSSPNSPGSRDAAPADAAGGRTSDAQAPGAAARQQAQGQGPAEPSRGSADDSKPSAEPSSDAAAANQTEFQRFVAQTTGRSLPLFGYELFTRGNFTASQGAAVPASYVLGPGDEIVVQVYGAIDLTERLVVDREGRVLIPQAGPLTLSGVRLGEAEKVLAAHLRRIYRNFNLTVTMGRVRSTEVFVVGQARNPGKHVVSGLSTLINALFETGGPSANGSLRAVQLRRAGRTVATVDLYRFLAMGDSGGDEKLQPGDVIFIPPAGPRAAVLGSVNAPAVYELLPGETLAQVLALSGGLPVLAAPQKAQLERVNPARAVARYVEDFALDAAGLARPLQAGDVLTVFQISPQIVDGITLQGHVAKPMRYTHLPGMRVRDLVTDGSMLVPVSYWLRVNAGTGIPGLDRPEVNLEYATIQRLEPSRLRTVIIPFHLAKALNGVPAENLLLQPGDIVRVYGADEPTPQALDSISVTAPFLRVAQRHAWRPGFTVRDAIPSGEWLREQVARAVRASGGSLGDTYASDEVNLDYATIRRLDGQSLRSELIAFNLARALQGDPQDNLALQPGDQIAIYGPKDTLPETLNSVSLRGEAIGAERRFVWRPGFAIRDLIPSADWLVTRYNYWLRGSGKELRNELNWDYAQVLRRLPATLQTEALNFSLGGAVLQGRAEDNLPLQPGDRIELFTTQQIAVPVSKRVRMVALSGEVRVPGVYQAAPG